MGRIDSNSSIGTFLNCPKSYQFRYEERLESLGYATALGYGTFVHSYIEALHGGDSDVATGALTRELERLALIGDEQRRNEACVQAAHDFALAGGVVERWARYWGAYPDYLGDKHLSFLETEKEWALPLEPGGDTLVGKRDGIVKHQHFGKHLLYEVKTAGDRDRETYKAKLQLERQISTNIYAVRAEGKACDGVLYDILWKPALIRKVNRKTMPDESLDDFRARILADIDERPHHYFERIIIYRSEADIREALGDLGMQYAYMDYASRVGYTRNQGACEKFGRLCPFFHLCLDNQPESRSAFRVRDKKLPELSAEVQS